MEIKWTKDCPIKPGDYLMHNPPIHFVKRMQIFTGERYGLPDDNALYTIFGWGSGKPCPLDKIADRGFWWFGPIPDPPEWDVMP